MPSQLGEHPGTLGSCLVPALGVQHPVLLHPGDREAKICLSIPMDVTAKSGIFGELGIVFVLNEGRGEAAACGTRSRSAARSPPAACVASCWQTPACSTLFLIIFYFKGPLITKISQQRS